MSILVLQSSWWGRESWLLCLICLPVVSWWLSGSSSRCHRVVCSLWLWYFLIIFIYYFWSRFPFWHYNDVRVFQKKPSKKWCFIRFVNKQLDLIAGWLKLKERHYIYKALGVMTSHRLLKPQSLRFFVDVILVCVCVCVWGGGDGCNISTLSGFDLIFDVPPTTFQ